MSHLIPVGGGVGVQIPPHIISAGHLENADLFFEVTALGVLIRPQTQQSHLPNAITEKTLQDADQGKNIIAHSDVESLYNTLQI